MGKIKVLRIITRMNIGGPAMHVALLSAELDAERFKTILVTGHVGSNEGDMAYIASENKIEPVVVPELRRELNITGDIISFFKLYKFIRKEKPDIVHTHTAKAGTLGRLAALLAGVPFIVHTFHGHVFHSYFRPLKTGFFLLVERLLAGITDKIIVISEEQKKEIKRFLRLKRDGKFVLIPLGLKLNKFLSDDKGGGRNRLRTELHIQEEAIVTGTIGRLTSVKNQRMFFEVAREVKQKNTGKKLKFIVVGDGELKDELVALSSELGIKDDTVFVGWRKDIESVYKAMDIVALTSLNEGTPVSLIEALASAKAVVATDVGGVRGVVKGGMSGFVVPLNDIKAFSEAVLDLINNEEKRKKFGLYGRNFVSGKYAKENLISAIEDLYVKGLKEKVKK